MPEEGQTLTLYMTNGTTLRFESVTEFERLDDLLVFDYVSASRPGTGVRASFLRHQLAGWSIGE